MTSTDRGISNVILYNENSNPVANSVSYMASTNGVVGTGTAAATVNSIGFLFHTAADTKRLEIHKIDICFTGGATLGTGVVSIHGAFISAQNGTPGGTSQTINPCERSDAASSAIFRTGANAPTRVTGDLMCFNFSGPASNMCSWNSTLSGKPIVLRASTQEGFEIRTNIQTALSTQSQISVTFYWTEL